MTTISNPQHPAPPAISASRTPRLAVALFRRYLRACTAGSATRTNPLATGPFGTLDEHRRLLPAHPAPARSE
ncbi:hypothetical protein [Streptomyces sp. NPDC051561]|uniref:hypothetical protein n=1 Tax=Streptomyces sp. NPDC051561 TaxID=3365658 RepID=UPI0037A8D247